jgi:glycosyltransferase involved in cell wall biosynthesis
MKMLRILQIIPSVDIGGAERMLLDLIRGIDRDHFLPNVVCLGDRPSLREAGISCDTSSIELFHGKKDCGFLIRLLKVLRESKPDIIHSHSLLTHYYSGIAGLLTSIPVIATFHSNDAIVTLGERIAVRSIITTSRYLVVVTPEQCQHFGLNASSKKTRYIPNGTPLASVSLEEAATIRKRAREALRIQDKEYVSVCIANFRPVKGHSFLLAAAKIVAQVVPNFRLLLVGDGPLRGNLEDTVKEAGVSSVVHFLGFRTDIVEILAASDLLISPSLSEANSIAIMEAMALAKPVIATNVGGNKQLIENLVCGILVAPQSPGPLADAIVWMISNEAEAASMGLNGRRKVLDRFDVKAMVARYEQLYFEAAGMKFAESVKCVKDMLDT